MTIRTLGLDSGVTSLQDHRLALGAFMGPGASALERRGGLYYYPGAADLFSAAALQGQVSPFVAVVDGTSNSLQGQVVVVVDAAVTLTFSAGEAAVARTDRVVLQVRDNAYDASGSTDARVVVVKGNTSTGAANAVPASSLLLWELVVPIGASSINFPSARVDRRTWAATPLRIPVNSQTERDALPSVPGLEVTRLDTGEVHQYWSGAWRTLLPVAAPTSSVSYVRKSSDTARSSTTTLADDPHLSMALLANSTYLLDGLIIYSVSSIADLKMNMTVPSGATAWYYYGGFDPAGATGAGVGSVGTAVVSGNSTVGGAGNGQKLAVLVRGIIRTAGSAGNMVYQWSQVTSDSGSLTLFTDSFLKLEKVA